MLESWNRKRYGAHQQIDVNFGGVLRLEKEAPTKPVIETTAAAVFEDEAEKPEQQGGHLALAAPAKSSKEFEERAASGEFDQAEVTFKDADGKPAALRPDVLALRKQLEDFKTRGPKVRQPSHHVTIYKPDEPDKAVIAEDEEPEPQTLRDHPRGYEAPKVHPYRPPVYSKPERDVGSGREGIGRGPDPKKIGPHVGFRVPQR